MTNMKNKIFYYYYIIKMENKIIVRLLCIAILVGLGSSATLAYTCNVANCQVCSYTGVCGLCDNNYILQINTTTSISYCQAVACNITNCLTCWQDNICTTCAPSYYVAPDGSCLAGSAPDKCIRFIGCLSCNQSQCNLCKIGFYLDNGICFRIFTAQIQYCSSYFNWLTCQVCSSGYMVTMGYTCQIIPNFNCTLSNCVYCTSNNVCGSCAAGYQISSNQCVPQTCNIPNCLSCNQTVCQACQQTYALVNGSCFQKSYGCSVQNCLYCQAPGLCSQCQPGYRFFYITNDRQTILGTICVEQTPENWSQQFQNCLKVRSSPSYTTNLFFGCDECEPGFVVASGYCVANLTLGSYNCNIQNCLYCIQNNVCGRCVNGYSAFASRLNMCVKDYSPIPNCLKTPIGIDIYCEICAPGYALINSGGGCALINTNVTCNITGCIYCLSNNSCSACSPGFSLVNGSCPAICNIVGCYQCANSTTCALCQYQYAPTKSGLCANASNMPLSYCQLQFGSMCTSCSYYKCQDCYAGYTLNDWNGDCCPSPQIKLAYCDQQYIYWDQSSCDYDIACDKCSKGAINLNLYETGNYICLQLPCLIANCSYCFQSSVCIVCKQGYTLVNNVCTAYTVQSNCTISNCVTCDPNNNRSCTQCLNGYVLYMGACVCNFQNCLQCNGGAFCTRCPTPLTVKVGYQSGCFQIDFNALCTIPNCYSCYNTNACSRCDDGYSLQSDNTCQQNPCNSSNNCTLCSADQFICYVCNQGYIQSPNTTYACTPIPPNYSCTVPGCSLCSSATVCQTCSPFFQLLANNTCQPYQCLPDCALCIAPNSCLICDIGFALSTNNTCVDTTGSQASCSSIPNCIQCQIYDDGTISTTLCVRCYTGLQPINGGQLCAPQTCKVPNCQICVEQGSPYVTASQLCFVCVQGYQLNQFLQCVQIAPALNTPNCSNIYNCLFCGQQNYCDFCAPSWQPVGGQCVTTKFCSSISNCVQCISPTSCTQCSPNYTVVSVNNVTQCSLSNCSIANCLVCSTSSTFCNQCASIMTFNGTVCRCPGNQQFAGGVCTCTNGYVLYNITCYQCQIVNCQYCTGKNVCGQCVSNYVLSANACTCPSGFIQGNSTCECPTGYNIYQNTCIQCNVNGCQNCSTANVCSTCMNNLVLNNSACVCPTGQSLYNNTCYICGVPNCVSCSSNNVCQQCGSNYVANGYGLCGCAVNSTQYNGTCVLCSIGNCSLCLQPNICASCLVSYTLSNNVCIYCNIPYCVSCTSANVCGTCAANYVLSSAACVPNCNISNCNSCMSQVGCRSCVGNLIPVSNYSACGCAANYTLYNISCISCPIQYCGSCHSANVCNQCINTFVLSNNNTCACPPMSTIYNNTCIVCNIQNCNMCNATNNCITCAPLYTLLADACLPCSVSNCTSCSTPQYCSNCAPGLVVSAEGDSCVLCNVSGCLLCTNDSKCVACTPGLQLSYDNNTCVVCNVQGCAVCSANNTCQTCARGYSISNNSCVLCLYPCGSCVGGSATVCVSCVQPYSSSPSNGSCYTCNVGSCVQCQVSSPSVCQQCASNHTLINNTCVYVSACSIYCHTCINYSICQKCLPGYILNPSNSSNCIQCTVPDCDTCSTTNTSICTTCYSGYYVNTNNTCTLCPYSNCHTCTPSACITFKLSTNQIAVVVNNVTYPSMCDPGCRVCSYVNPAVCIMCTDGFALAVGSVCTPCNYPCASCAAPNPNACLSCYDNYVLNGTSCTTCLLSSNCLTCKSANPAQCTTCILGYTFNPNNSVCSIKCPPLCLTCTTDTACTTCISGYSVSATGVCLPCVYNCRICSGTDQGVCLQCGPGFYLPVNTNQCIQCSANCLECNSQGCTTCLPSYYLSTQLTCVLNCAFPCATCSSASPSACTSCLLGYSYNSTSNMCTSVISCPGGVCYACPLTYALSNNTCIQCTASNCARCSPSTPSLCISCATGYYLNSQNLTCSQCPPSCKQCSNSINCVSCSSGYTILVQYVSSASICVACQFPCSQCVTNSYTCTACTTGYQLSGWNCQTIFNYGFFISLNTNLTNFYANYYALLMALLKPINTTNLLYITVTSLLPGSVNITGTISTQQQSNSDAAGTEFYGIQDVLNQATIATMPIITYSLHPNGGSVPPQPGPNDNSFPVLAVVLGICIPILIIIILIIIYCIVKSRKQKQRQNDIATITNYKTQQDRTQIRSYKGQTQQKRQTQLSDRPSSIKQKFGVRIIEDLILKCEE